MIKCKECGTPHTNKSEESKYQEVSDTCMRCTSVLWAFNASIKAINFHIPLVGENRPKRKITITGYKIEKI